MVRKEFEKFEQSICAFESGDCRKPRVGDAFGFMTSFFAFSEYLSGYDQRRQLKLKNIVLLLNFNLCVSRIARIFRLSPLKKETT